MSSIILPEKKVAQMDNKSYPFRKPKFGGSLKPDRVTGYKKMGGSLNKFQVMPKMEYKGRGTKKKIGKGVSVQLLKSLFGYY